MELKDFIKRTLLDVVDGVEEANQEKDRFRLSGHTNMDTNQIGQKIKFDISILVDKNSESDVKGGIKVALVNLGGGVKESENSQNIHKIKFEVFIKGKAKQK